MRAGPYPSSSPRDPYYRPVPTPGVDDGLAAPAPCGDKPGVTLLPDTLLEPVAPTPPEHAGLVAVDPRLPALGCEPPEPVAPAHGLPTALVPAPVDNPVDPRLLPPLNVPVVLRPVGPVPGAVTEDGTPVGLPPTLPLPPPLLPLAPPPAAFPALPPPI